MQAEDFFNAYLVLKENNEAFIERQANSLGKTIEESKVMNLKGQTHCCPSKEKINRLKSQLIDTM